MGSGEGMKEDRLEADGLVEQEEEGVEEGMLGEGRLGKEELQKNEGMEEEAAEVEEERLGEGEGEVVEEVFGGGGT